jgi:ABC-type polysaccharide/polyol phosphate export permease
VLNVYFRDIQHLFGIALQFWFYATPVIYPVGLVREATEGRKWLFDLYMLNPMTRFVEVYRDLLYHVRLPELVDLLYLSAVSLAVLALGIVVFNRLEPKLAEEL